MKASKTDGQDTKTTMAMFERLQRIETRLVRGFGEMGVKVVDDEDWCNVDIERLEIHLKGLGRNIRSIQLAIASAGGCSGDYYDVIVDGEIEATVRA